MSRGHYLSKLLLNKSSHGLGLQLFKKFVLIFYFGELRINGQLPNRAYKLCDYLLDDYRLMVDWSRLSAENQKRLKDWLFINQQATLRSRYYDNYRVNDRQGFPEERSLSLWGKFANSLLFKRRYYAWDLNTSILGHSCEIKQINICIGAKGALFDLIPTWKHLFNQESNSVLDEYVGDRLAQNIKRLILTDQMVNQLFAIDLESYNYQRIINAPHPMAIDVLNDDLRKYRMLTFRENHGYVKKKNIFQVWFNLFIQWLFALIKPKKKPKVVYQYKTLLKEEELSVGIDIKNGSVFVCEKRPEIDTFVFSGGGAKIFGHLGAVNEFRAQGILPKNYAGSSAGAIMALFLFLGYRSDEIKSIFQWFRKENLIDYSLALAGLSTTKRLKQALDWIVLNKVLEVIRKNPEDFSSKEARAFLQQAIFPPNKISFQTVEMLKAFCSATGFGHRLIVTATNSTIEQTEIFSYEVTPKLELSEAVKISASLPVLYHPTERDGNQFIDGGVMNNLPLSAFTSDDSTLLEHELHANLRVLAFQFDNGYEQKLLHSNRPIYRENWLLNRIYSFATGIKDPASAWVRERRLLRSYACQSILIDVGKVSASNFSVSPFLREKMINAGRKAARDYIDSHYLNNKIDQDGVLYRSFENLEELLLYSARRQALDLFKRLTNAIRYSMHVTETYKQKLINRAQELENSYFAYLPKLEAPSKNPFNFYKVDIGEKAKFNEDYLALELFQLLFPILAQDWMALPTNKDKALANIIDILVEARHELTIGNAALIFNKIKENLLTFQGKTHLFIYLLKNILLMVNKQSIGKSIHFANKLIKAFNSSCHKPMLKDKEFIQSWHLTLEESKLLLNTLARDQKVERKESMMECNESNHRIVTNIQPAAAF